MAIMGLSDAQRDGFDRRISRIRKGGANTMGNIEIGPRDEVRAKDGTPTTTVRVKKKKKQVSGIGQNSGMGVLLLAAFFGAMSMFVGQSVSFHLFEEGGLAPIDFPFPEFTEYLPYAPLAIGGVLALLFGWTFHLTRGLRFIALMGGFAALYHYKTDVIQAVPSLYEAFFSKDYVQIALAAAG